MQALPECTVEQTHDKHMVEQYYSDNCYLMGTHQVNQDQVAMLISKLSKNKSPGLDGITAEHLIYGKSSLLCSLLASLYTIILSRACVPTLVTTGLIVPILKKSTLNANIAKNYRPITISSIHTKMAEALILPDTDLSDTQFGFHENRGTAFACNLLNDITSYFKSQNSPVFVAALDAEKCFDSICHVSLFLKLIHVLPVHEWLLLYNWYNKLNAVVKWNGSYSKPFDVTRGTRQGSVLSPYLFNIFINQLLLDLNNCDAGVRIGDTLYNYMAYADDITLFSTNVQDLQSLIDVCDAYSKRWKFKFGVEKSKCMIVGKCPLYQDPKWRLGDKRMNMYVMFLLRQRRLNKIIIMTGGLVAPGGCDVSEPDAWGVKPGACCVGAAISLCRTLMLTAPALCNTGGLTSSVSPVPSISCASSSVTS